MLSRRNVRVKVMQQLYSLAQDKELTFDAAIRAFHNTIQSAYQLYLLNLYCLVRICSIAVEDARVRQNKHIKTDEDKVFTVLKKILLSKKNSRIPDSKMPLMKTFSGKFTRSY